MNTFDNYYKTLEIEPGSTFEEVKQSYKVLVQVWHPDRFTYKQELQQKAQEKVKKINDAYERLESFYLSSDTQASSKKEKNTHNCTHASSNDTQASSKKEKNTQTYTYAISEKLVLEPVFYLHLYPDLQQAFGKYNYKAATKHWVHDGIKEGRHNSPAFSASYYLEKYPDLQQAFGANNYKAAVEHWLSDGIKEGRHGSPSFYPAYYLSIYYDLQQAFGANNYKAAIEHWLSNGIKEGRRGVP